MALMEKRVVIPTIITQEALIFNRITAIGDCISEALNHKNAIANESTDTICDI